MRKCRYMAGCLWLLCFCLSLQAISLAEESHKTKFETKKFKIHPALPAYVFRVRWHKDADFIDRIEVQRNGSPKVIQTIEEVEVQSPPPDFEHLQVEDVNFDGFKDLKIFGWAGATGNVGYSYWLFNKKKGVFVFHEKLSDLCDPQPEPKTKEVVSYCKGGMVGQEYTEQTFKWSKKGNLVLVLEETQTWDDEKEHFIKVVKKRSKGKMRVIEKEIITTWE